jgi:RNA polymerase sigma-70 factor, ECF subfamily
VEELFRRHKRGLDQFLVQIIKSRPLAEDLLQETFLTALGFGGRLGEVRHARAWLYGIALNEALGALRRARHEHTALERLARQSELYAPDPAAALEVRDLLERHLGLEDRALVVLRYLHGFRAEELAAMSGHTPEAVRQRLSRARRTLARAAEPERAAPAPTGAAAR